MKQIIVMLGIVFLLGCSTQITNNNVIEMKNIDYSKYEKATLAGGCFWCIESAFQEMPGVVDAINGYTGGNVKNPTYEQVSSGSTGHLEAVEVYFDPNIVSYKEIIEHFFKQIDPTDNEGQFADKGSQYKTAIFYNNEEQKKVAEEVIKELDESEKYNKPIVTQILPEEVFYQAEEYHQDYYLKQGPSYDRYAEGSGRKGYIEETWGDEAIPKTCENVELTSMQKKVACDGGTEPAFSNEYWDNKEEGIYIDIVTGEPLFSSTEKFDSGTGWPAFYEPIKGSSIIEKEDNSLGMKRTEVKTKTTHLGHVFDDAPGGKLRYCINSASLKFIPKDDLKKEGYDKYLELFN